jgi:hypothetical protein
MNTPLPSKKQECSKIEMAALIWRAIDQDAIVNRGNPLKQEAERHARRELRRVIDNANAKAGQP